MSGRKQQPREIQKLIDLPRVPKFTVMETDGPQAGHTTSNGSLTEHKAGQTQMGEDEGGGEGREWCRERRGEGRGQRKEKNVEEGRRRKNINEAGNKENEREEREEKTEGKGGRDKEGGKGGVGEKRRKRREKDKQGHRIRTGKVKERNNRNWWPQIRGSLFHSFSPIKLLNRK